MPDGLTAMTVLVNKLLKIYVIRGIFRELRKTTKKNPISQNAAYQYVMECSRQHQITDQRVCKAETELYFMASAYHCYLNGTRKHQELFHRYYGQGERTVQETASIVGLGLPNPTVEPH